MFSNFKFYLSSTSIVFFYCFIFLILSIAMGEFENNIIPNEYFVDIFMRGRNSHSAIVSYFVFLLIILLSILTIDFISREHIKINKSLLLFVAISLIVKRFVYLNFDGIDELSAGFIVGSFFFSTAMIGLIPFFILYFKNNIYHDNYRNITIGFIVITLCFMIEHIIHVHYITQNYLSHLTANLSNFASYISAFLIYIYYKNHIALNPHPSYNWLLDLIKATTALFGVPMLFLFMIFA